MNFSISLATQLRRTTLRSLTAFALLSSPWIVATAAPVLSGTPATSVVAAHYYAFQPGATDSGKTLTFAIANKPSWAHFDTTSGRLYGTPLPQTNVGTYANILISASDGSSRTYLAPFSVRVLPLANIPPRISGSPAGTAEVGQAYSFQASASDPNGLSIKFGIWNKPSWASFDSNTGRLSGTPAAANVGSYPNIVITAYDGFMKTTLPGFTIVVQADPTTPPTETTPPPPATGSATLSWTPPTVNSDGSVLANLAGYHIYYGTTPDNLTENVTVANPGLARYVLSGLSANSWYFSMTAYNSTGQESARTAVETLIVQ